MVRDEKKSTEGTRERQQSNEMIAHLPVKLASSAPTLLFLNMTATAGLGLITRSDVERSWCFESQEAFPLELCVSIPRKSPVAC